MDNTKQSIISIATGTGGLERGLKYAGVNVGISVFVEIEAFIIANLVTAMETNKMDAAPIWANIKTFPAEKFRGKIHGITAGYPCQPFSNAGKRGGIEDPRHIFPYILRTIKAVEPIWCFFENVEGHLSLGYKEVYQSLRDSGYRIEAGIFSADEVGAPHIRKRLFILAIKMEYANASTFKRIIFRNEQTLTNSRSSSKVANTCSKRSRKVFENTESKQFVQNGFSWPVGPGRKQGIWEHPRTVKSSMGCTAHGYNYRTDFLRALGNAVVPQTACKAFLTLIDKF